MPHQSAEWAIAPLPAAAAAEGRLKDRSDPASMESILQELKEAARIADEIAEHAAAVHAQDSLRREESEKQPSSPASEIFEPVPRLPQYASDAPILISRAERHHRHKRSFWSRLFGR
jgi:hypothetical protein